MFGFQTLSCLQDIPVVRSSTNKLQDVYSKAKDTSVLIRLPCNVAETVADKSLKVALTVVNPFFKPFSGSVHKIDDYAAGKIRQIESKYPVINTPTEDVVNTFNEKTEPVRNVMNSVKDTTTSTIQHGKDTVSNVATATVNKASNVADSVFSFCETHVPGIQRLNNGKKTGLNGFVFSTVGSLFNYFFQTTESSIIWFRMLVVFYLLKVKQVNDIVLNKIQRQPLFTLPQRVLVQAGVLLDYFAQQISPDERTLNELKKTKQQPRFNQQQQQPRSNQQQQYYNNRQSVKPNPSVTTRQSVVTTKEETVVTRTNNNSNLTDTEDLYARLGNGDYRQSAYDVDNSTYTTEPVDLVASGDIAQLHARLQPNDIELLYSRLPNDIVPTEDNQDVLNQDQQQLYARIIGKELENQGYTVNDDEE